MDISKISLSLVSHTNVGKTTLARTLLGRDIGEVRDAPHVTDFADAHLMVETPAGDQLYLWDTPGFGDSLRLVKRLRGATHPIGWFLSQVWDRWRDRPFWASQQAMRNVRDQADLMLYLVNAAESPAAAGYVVAEMELLGWMDKPVLVLLNQLGQARPDGQEASELEAWRVHLAAFPQVREVLSFDAFARCWVQEATLLDSIRAALPEGKQGAMGRLREVWWSRRLETFDASVAALSASLSRLACRTEPVPEGHSWTARLRRVVQAIGITKSEESPVSAAQAALAEHMDAEVRANTVELIRLYGLEGRAEGEILDRIARQFQVQLRMDEGKAALWGGMLSGALAGLKADLLSGGLTMGGGLLAGGLLGAMGGAGLARCVNLVRGHDHSFVAWNSEALDQMTDAAMLRYLAVAHFGRGRGEWAQSEAPAHWRESVVRALAPHREAFGLIWKERANDKDVDPSMIRAALEPLFRNSLSDVLHLIYPVIPRID